MIKQFNKDNLKEVRQDIKEALDAVARKHGLLSLSIGNISYSDMKFTTRVTAVAIPTLGNIKIETINITSKGLPEAPNFYIGKKFMTNGTMFDVVEHKPANRKYPLIGKNSNGTRYKFSLEQVHKNLV